MSAEPSRIVCAADSSAGASIIARPSVFASGVANEMALCGLLLARAQATLAAAWSMDSLANEMPATTRGRLADASARAVSFMSACSCLAESSRGA